MCSEKNHISIHINLAQHRHTHTHTKHTHKQTKLQTKPKDHVPPGVGLDNHLHDEGEQGEGDHTAPGVQQAARGPA